MSDSGDNLKYKWTPESTTLLVSVWTDKQVQKQFSYSTKPQLIWESVARYMKKKGYNVSAKQCRSRMKHVLVCYREAKRAGTRAGVEQYYECIDKVLKNRRSDGLDPAHVNGVDTVDSTSVIKSPPKDVKTNKNLQMRYKYQEPLESLYRTEALSPTWAAPREEDYPDSPESNETVLAQPFRVLSPVRDAATNTRHQLDHLARKSLPPNAVPVMEPAIQETFQRNTFSNNRFSEVPFQNSVQNVHNQIIQENMQQNQALLHQNMLQNQLSDNNLLQLNPTTYRHNLLNTNQYDALYADQGVQWRTGNDQLQNYPLASQNQAPENILRARNLFQQNPINNQAMPQEPRKPSFRQNLAANYRQYQDLRGLQNYASNMNQKGLLSPRYSPEFAPNMNEAFCETAKEEKAHNLNETFDQRLPAQNGMNLPNIDATTLTNNATFNDDTLSIDFLQESPSPSEDGIPKMKDFAVNTDTETMPNAPFRKKKAQKLEQLMLSAISSQNDVVNKILAAQNDMVTKFLDVDRDRQNRLESRLDHLLDVVHATVLNKTPEKDSETDSEMPPSLPEPLITNLNPPPKPGVIPPKLDLVPPKPCRFPSTSYSTAQIINQNTAMTKPGMVSPPPKKLGSIWTKLGPVSQSPFVKAQQQLGFQTIAIRESRTQSSAERRIINDVRMNMDSRCLIEETVAFIENEKQLQEKIENARLQEKMGQALTAKKKLFTHREPTAAMILSAAFLESEMQYLELVENARIQCGSNEITQMCMRYLHHREKEDDDLLAGQGDSYDRLRKLKLDERFKDEPCDSSTPAKPSAPGLDEPKQTIQQLAHLVMQSARWRDVANNKVRPFEANGKDEPRREELRRDDFITGEIRREELRKEELRREELETKIQSEEMEKRRREEVAKVETRKPIRIQQDVNARTLNWIQDRYSYGDELTKNRRINLPEPGPLTKVRPIGFSIDGLNLLDSKPVYERRDYNFARAGLDDRIGTKKPNVHFYDDMGPFAQIQQTYAHRYYTLQNSRQILNDNNGALVPKNRDMIDRYMKEMGPRRGKDDSDDEEFLDTTASMPPVPASRRGSLTSDGTSKSGKGGCVIS
ncbi:uncharacterized protein LOC117171250 isoform X2 [Belonocnema kinseyi]|nr:uncharacterized protein LOC117171250 isoform X2 [Belonocnema kinseyi]